MLDILAALGQAIATAASMGWKILWPLILGFTLSGVIQAIVRKEAITRLMSDDGPRSISIASLFGAASSSCSYAAVALARALFRRGANFTAAMAFEIASTNLVLELGLILAFTMGWQFTAAEFVGGPIMIVVVALGFRLWMRGRIVERAREQADKGVAGSMEGHAGMDMSVGGEGSFFSRLFSADGVVAVSRYFVMDWAAVLRDILIGLLIAGAFAAWVPQQWLQTVFLASDPTLAFILGPLLGPLIAVISFVCSVGNVPLAAVLWNGGISFGGVVSFLFGDLIIIPIILISEVLRHGGGPAHQRHLLWGDGDRGLRGRVALHPDRAGAIRPPPHRGRGGHQLGLHDLAQHRLPRSCGRAARRLLPQRQRTDAEGDGRRAGGERARPISWRAAASHGARAVRQRRRWPT